jgi:hypothetical protein
VPQHANRQAVDVVPNPADYALERGRISVLRASNKLLKRLVHPPWLRQ